nr:hypothetical protein [uncultured Thiodictyon sp.]
MDSERVPVFERKQIADDVETAAYLGGINGHTAKSVVAQQSVECVEIVRGDVGADVFVVEGVGRALGDDDDHAIGVIRGWPGPVVRTCDDAGAVDDAEIVLDRRLAVARGREKKDLGADVAQALEIQPPERDAARLQGHGEANRASAAGLFAQNIEEGAVGEAGHRDRDLSGGSVQAPGNFLLDVVEVDRGFHAH